MMFDSNARMSLAAHVSGCGCENDVDVFIILLQDQTNAVRTD